MNNRKMKQVDDVLEVIKAHTCETCTGRSKKHLLVYWYDIINDVLPHSKRVCSTKYLARIFKALRSRGVYHEPFLLGKKKAQIHDNYYIYLEDKR